MQSLTPNLAAGGEVFWLPNQLRSGVGVTLRHQGEKHIATMQASNTGILSAQYAHKVTDKVSPEHPPAPCTGTNAPRIQRCRGVTEFKRHGSQPPSSAYGPCIPSHMSCMMLRQGVAQGVWMALRKHAVNTHEAVVLCD